MPTRGVPLRLFLTCWVVYCLHFATDFAREHFLVARMVEQHTFTLDPYYGMHPDIFQLPNGHAYHGANPGISMLGAIPYFILHPVVEAVVAGELEARAARGDTSAVYNDPRPARQEFYRTARSHGWDIRFGLIGLITMVFCMAPISAAGAVILNRTLAGAGLSPKLALGGALLYAFGTPIFFRSAYLNQNLAVGVFAFASFALLWNPGEWTGLKPRARLLMAGLLSGLALLCDYSGGVLLGLIGLYAVWKAMRDGTIREAIADGAWFTLGALGPILLLWWYQYSCFGNPFLPPQNYMPSSQYLSGTGYKGVTGPRGDLFSMLLLDPRFGLLVTAPVLCFALLAPYFAWRRRSFLGTRELTFLLVIPLGLILFFSSVVYTRLQYITGIRYLIPAIPFLIVPTLAVLIRVPRIIGLSAALFSFALSWPLAMSRLEEQQTSILANLKAVYLAGFRLPALTTLSRMAAQYAPEAAGSISPLPLFALAGAVIFMIWKVGEPGRPLRADDGSD